MPATNFRSRISPNSTPAASLLLIVLLVVMSASASASASPSPSARDRHVIKFRSPNLYPEGLAWDPSAQHFIVGSLRDRTLYSVSDAGVVYTLISDPSLPSNSSFLGLAVDSKRRRLLAAVHNPLSDPPFNALAVYDLQSLARIFLSEFSSSSGDVANGVAVDFAGNAYVTNSGNNLIWKVDSEGRGSSVFSRSPLFTRFDPGDADSPYATCGLNGIAYVSKGYLLAIQSNTGKMFKVDAVDGTARVVAIGGGDLAGGDGLVVREDGAAVIVTPLGSAWVVKSDDSWSQGRVIDKIALDGGWDQGFPTSVTVGGGERVYVVYGYVEEGIKGNNNNSGSREWFRIEEVRKSSEDEEYVWMFVLIGLGLAYFTFWRFQMRNLVKSMDNKME